MANSLEVRSPFLDYRLVEWTARLPRGVLLTSSAGKLPLRSIARELLPSAAHGVKRGFGAPVDAWFRQPAGRKLVEDRLLSRESACRRLWRPAAVTQMLKAQSAGTRDLGFLFWRLLVLEGWARSHDVTFDFGTAASGRP